MGRTINGKTLEEVMRRLKEEFEELITDEKGRPAISYEQLRERLDEVLGLNYSFEALNVRLIEVDGKKAFCGDGLITIKDDDGKIVCKRMHGGGEDIIMAKNGGKSVDLSNDYSRAISTIFKKACKSLSMDDQLQKLRNEDKYVSAQKSKGNNSSKNKSNKNNKDNVRSIDDKKAAKEGDMIAQEDYSSSCETSKNFKIKVKKDGKEGFLLFWKNQLDEKFIEGIKKIKIGYKFDLSKLEIIEKTYNNELQFHVQLKAA